MAIKIAVANQKGGVGKTTTAINIADALTHCGYDVLFIDLDPQHNSTDTFGAQISGVNTIVDLLKGDCSAEDAIQITPMGKIIAGDFLLAQEEGGFQSKIGRYSILKKALKQINDQFDYIIMDTPPNLGIYMLNALTAADGVIIPIKAEKYAIDGLGLLVETINDVVENTNENLKIYGVLLNVYDMRNSLDKNIWNILPDECENRGFRVFKTPIRISQEVKKVQALENEYNEQGECISIVNRSLFEKYGSSNAAVDYVSVVKEILEVQ